MNFMNKSTIRGFLANTMYNFSGRSTTSASFLPPLKERGSLFIPNLRNRFVSCSPPFSTMIPSIGNRTDESREKRRESAFNFKAYMVEKLSSVNKALDAAVPLKEPIKIHEAMRYSLLSGSKRVCSIVCIASCELAGGTESIAMPAACSLEMIVTLSLMLDDLPSMDNSDFRRQKPSNHKVFGESMTLLAAMSLQALAFEHIAKAAKDISSTKILRVISELATLIGTEGVAGGQAADLELEGKSGIELEQVEHIHLHKAASFFEAAAVAGGILGGASEEEIIRLRNYSKYAGVLYQVVDDILDVTKSDQELGKPTGKDFVSDKATFPKIIGLEESRKVAEKLVREAQAQLVGFDPEKAAPLKALVDFAYDRQK